MRTIRTGALQLRAHDRTDYERTKHSLFERIAQACSELDVLVVPEGTIPAYVLGTQPVEGQLLEDATAALSRIARETSTVLVVGIAKQTDGRLHNAALIFERDGNVAGRADKTFLWHFDRKWFAPGERLEPVQTSAGAIGALVCADGRMPEIAAHLTDAGAELLAMPTAWVTSGRDPVHLENVQADLLARVRAYENGVPFVAANKCGAELGMVAYCGKSQIVDAAGTTLALASETEPELILATVEVGVRAPKRVPRAEFAPRGAASVETTRVTISLDIPADIDERLSLLDASYALAPNAPERLARLDSVVPCARVTAAQIADPHLLVQARLSGIRVAIVTSDENDPWLDTIARARALELRMYLVVFDLTAQRAYVIDPDGSTIAGTFGDYRIASFPLDVRRTNATLVAPGTDVAEGLERVRAISERGVRA